MDRDDSDGLWWQQDAEKDQQFLSQKVVVNTIDACYIADPGGKIQFLGYRILPCKDCLKIWHRKYNFGAPRLNI